MNIYTHICINTYIFLCKLNYMFPNVWKSILLTLYYHAYSKDSNHLASISTDDLNNKIYT